MREFSVILLLALVMFMSPQAPGAGHGDEPAGLITIEPGRNWSLVGEWDLSDNQDSIPPFRYTFSILRLKDSYALVWYGGLIAGCCPWPQATPLKQLSETAFVSAIDNTELEILPDSSLVVRYVDGRVHKLPMTAPDKRFSATWE